MALKTFKIIEKAINDGRLKTPFSSVDLRNACPELNKNTCNGFLSKHRQGNPGKYTELFIRLNGRKYELINPKI